jgi:hypothetical protein
MKASADKTNAIPAQPDETFFLPLGRKLSFHLSYQMTKSRRHAIAIR